MAVGTHTTLAGIARTTPAGDDVYRAVIGFVTDAAAMSRDELEVAIRDEPPLSGDPRLDAALAALAEHFAFHADLDAPPWALRPIRFLDEAWFPVDLPSMRVRAFVSSPGAFARRLIFIDRSDLRRV